MSAPIFHADVYLGDREKLTTVPVYKDDTIATFNVRCSEYFLRNTDGKYDEETLDDYGLCIHGRLLHPCDKASDHREFSFFYFKPIADFVDEPYYKH